LAAEKLEFCFLRDSSGWRAPPAKEFHGEETNCVPTKVSVVSFTLLLTDAKK
jgi:hypothetical protein